MRYSRNRNRNRSGNSQRSIQPLIGFLGRAANKHFDQIELVLGGAAIIVGGIAFGRRHFAHFLQRRIGDRFPAQDFFGFSGPDDG
ncbi:hypothetical protein D3C83_46410 [compost metagenome]